jgi:NitT/TauT family transport system ATP-binding protein
VGPFITRFRSVLRPTQAAPPIEQPPEPAFDPAADLGEEPQPGGSPETAKASEYLKRDPAPMCRPGGPLAERPLAGELESGTEFRPPIIELRDVTKSFPIADGQRLTAFAHLDLKIPDHSKGEIVVLLGPSGCGKSTILNLISGFHEPDAGKVFVFGEEVRGPHGHSASVPQSYTCFPWLTVVQNVEFGLAITGIPQGQRRAVAFDYLQRVGMANRLDAYPRELSGGMQQRVAIARALAVKRKILLMDEPFGALDAQTREDMQQMLVSLWAEEKNTIIFVTHDIAEAVLLGSRVLVFPGQSGGKLEEMAIGLPRPRNAEVQKEEEFIALCAKLRQRLIKDVPAAEAPGPDALAVEEVSK